MTPSTQATEKLPDPLAQPLSLFTASHCSIVPAYMIAVSESTPGPIMVNLATYVGSSQAGLGGAVLATLAVVLPSFLVILLAAAVLKNLLENRYVKAVLGGLKPCVIGIILATGVYMTVHNGISGMGKPGLDLRPAAITAILAAVMWGAKPVLKRKVSPLALIAVSACLGILLYGI